MEIIDLATKREAFVPPEYRYLTPHKEVMKLHELWTNYKPLSKSKEIQQARNLYQEAAKLLQDEEEELVNVFHLINKGLFHNPKYHPFYALKGDIHMRRGQLVRAIKNYETAKKMTKFDPKLTDAEMKDMYIKQIVTAYGKRGDWYFENGMLLEALSDYEQIFQMKAHDIALSNMQDNLLKVLRKLEKYEMFQRYWDEFLTDADPARTAALLSLHAEYKIYLKQMAMARHMLLKALDLDENNVEAQELLKIVYNTGHTLITYTVLWCMHGCYDKALVTTEKALDCNPYNPGFILLKTIALRLAGRLDEAITWLENVSKNFYKLLEPRDTQNSIVGKLSIKEVKNELTKQWFLIRYDQAMKCMLNDKLQHAARIIYESQLTKYYMEPYITMGDSFLKRDNFDLALKSYLKCHDMIRELRLPPSRKTIDLTARIIDILNNRAQEAVNEGRLKDAIDITDKVLKILDGNQTELHQLGAQRGNALLCKARCLFQIAIKKKEESKECCELGADSLRFVRELNHTGLYRTLYGDRGIEEVIDRFAPKRKLPKSLKILMQYS